MLSSDQKAKPVINELVVLQDAMQEFANPISKTTFQALPRIYGKRKKKKYAIKYDFQQKNKPTKEKIYPVHHCFQGKQRLVDSRIVKEIQLDNQLSTRRYKTEIKRPNKQSTEKLSKPRNEICNKRYCFCNRQHNQTIMKSESKQQLKLNNFRGKSVRLPQISKSPEPDDVQSKHKIGIGMTKFQPDSEKKKRPLTLLDLLRSNQRLNSQINDGQDENPANSNRQGFTNRHLSNPKHAQSVSVQTQPDPSQQVPIQYHRKEVQVKPLGQAEEEEEDQNVKNSIQKDEIQKNVKVAKKEGQRYKLMESEESAQKNQNRQNNVTGPLQKTSRSPSKISKMGEEGEQRHQEIQNKFAQLKQNFQNNQSSDSQMDDSRSISSSLSASSISKYVFQKTKNAPTVFQSLNKQQRKSSFDSKIRVKSQKLKQQKQSDSKKKKEKFIFQKKNGLFVIPQEDEFVDYIKDYEPMSQKLKIKNLIKNENFKVVKSDDGVYFGEVVDEKKHGKGIMVTQRTIFEGKYNRDIKMQGCEKNIDGVYRGEFLNGVREGYGTFEWNNGQIFQGQWKNGTKNGFGIWKSPKGDFYEGEWRLNRQHGKGVFKHRLSTYRGYFVDFLKNGEGEQIFTNGDRYVGLYKEGKPHGQGKYIWADGSSYQGQFLKGVRQGFGIWKYSNGTVYEGEFENDFKSGKGREKYKTGELFEGLFKQGQKYEGTLYDANNNAIQITSEI